MRLSRLVPTLLLAATCWGADALPEGAALDTRPGIVGWTNGSAIDTVAAIVVGANEYGYDAYNLPAVAQEVAVVSNSFQRHLGVTPDMLRVTTGRDVTIGRVRNALHELVRKAGTGTMTLIIYWSGHGWTRDRDRQQMLFTYDSTENLLPSGEKFTDVVAINDHLLAWVDEAAAPIRAAGGKVVPAIIIDACRPNVKLPNQTAGVLAVDKSWQLFSTPDNTTADAYTSKAAKDGSLDSRSFAASLSVACQLLAGKGDKAGLKSVFEQTKAIMQQRGVTKLPTLTAPTVETEEPILVRQPRITFDIKIVDALVRSAPVPKATILMDGIETAAPEGAARISDQSLAKHALIVSAPGYRTFRDEALQLTERGLDGRTLTVALEPAAVRISGTITGGGLPTVVAEGAFGTPRPNFHVTQAQVDPITGAFTLLLPVDGDPAATLNLVIQKGGKKIKNLALPKRASMRAEPSGDYAHELGTLVLSTGGASDALDRLATNVGKGPLRLLNDEVRNVASHGKPTIPLDKQGAWDSAMLALENGQYSKARRELLSITKGVQGRDRALVGAYLALVEAREAESRDAAANREILGKRRAANAPEEQIAALLQVIGAQQIDDLRLAIPTDSQQIDFPTFKTRLVTAKETLGELPAESRPTVAKELLAVSSAMLVVLTSRGGQEAAILDLVQTCQGGGWDDKAWVAAADEAGWQAVASLMATARSEAIDSSDPNAWAAFDQKCEAWARWREHPQLTGHWYENLKERLKPEARKALRDARKEHEAGAGRMRQEFDLLGKAYAAGLTTHYQRQVDAERNALAIQLYEQGRSRFLNLISDLEALKDDNARTAAFTEAMAVITDVRQVYPKACDEVDAIRQDYIDHPAIRLYQDLWGSRDARWNEIALRLYADEPEGSVKEHRQALLQDGQNLPDPEGWLVRHEINDRDHQATLLAKARTSDAIADWNAVAVTYALSPVGRQARARIDQLTREALAKAEQQDSIDGWQLYLKEFPNGAATGKAAARIADLNLDKARRLDTDDGWRDFRRNFPQHPGVQEAEGFLDRSALAKAEKADTESAWQTYLDAWPSGKGAERARARLEGLRNEIALGAENKAFTEAKTRNTIPAWQAFLGTNPSKTARESAQAAINSLAWAEADRLNSETGWKAFVRDWPQHPRVEEARTNQGDCAWRETRSVGTIGALRDFVAAYPGHPKAAEAKALVHDAPWTEAQRLKSREGYQRFLDDQPSHPRRADAQKAIDDLDWNAAAAANSENAWMALADRVPAHPRAADARAKGLALRPYVGGATTGVANTLASRKDRMVAIAQDLRTGMNLKVGPKPLRVKLEQSQELAESWIIVTYDDGEEEEVGRRPWSQDGRKVDPAPARRELAERWKLHQKQWEAAFNRRKNLINELPPLIEELTALDADGEYGELILKSRTFVNSLPKP